MIYLLTAIVLSPGGSTHLYTNNTQNNTNNNRTTQITNNVCCVIRVGGRCLYEPNTVYVELTVIVLP